MKKYLLSIIVLLASCSHYDEEFVDDFHESNQEILTMDRNEMFSEFARALSKVVCENQDARQVVKEEALKQFDKNYEVLWISLRDKKVGNVTFRDLIEKASSRTFVNCLEEQYPLLNVLFPEIPMVNISPETYDVNNNDLPVILPGEKNNKLFSNGVLEDSLEIGEVPGFNVIVINENSRVVVGPQTRNGMRSYTFKSPNFDGTKTATITRASIESACITQIEWDAYANFHSSANDNSQKAYQRDYLYYGMTPTSEKGRFNSNTSEYISYIRVNPNAYFTITDKLSGTKHIDPLDPYIQTTDVEQYKRSLSNDELIDRMWTKGAYNFRFEVYHSNSSTPTVCYIPLKPSDIWNFNIELYDYRHSTWFRHSRYRYRIDPNKFTSKVVSLESSLVDFGKWDLSQEALTRYVRILEDDPKTNVSETVTREFDFTTSTKVSGNVKIGLGKDSDSKKGEANVGGEASTSSTKKETRTFTVSRSKESDELGSVTVYFYDPLIESVKPATTLAQTRLIRKTYNTGTIEFCISVK